MSLHRRNKINDCYLYQFSSLKYDNDCKLWDEKYHCQICSLSNGNDKFFRFWITARLHVFLHEVIGQYRYWKNKDVEAEIPKKNINNKEFAELKDLREIILKTHAEEIYYFPSEYYKLKQQFINYNSKFGLYRKNILEENFIFKGTAIILSYK